MSARAKLYFSAVVIVGALFTLGATLSWADVPDSLNYQGILKTAGGSSVPDGSYNVTFKIYNVASGGAALWTEAKSVSTVGGQFSTFLGSVTALPASVFSGPNRYLGITVAADPEMAPRTPIVAVAYSYRIATIDGATGGSISGDVAVSGGNLNLDPSSATTGNILKGGVPFIHTYGTSNTFLGVNAGNLTMSGTANTACGQAALSSNSTGTSNTANGRSALSSNTTGTSNTANGAYALCWNTSGYSNTASGNYALSSNTIGYNNTASGSGALSSNTTGIENTANGSGALTNNTTGPYNTANGSGALYSNTTGSSNTANGFYALRNNTTGNTNTACGDMALLGNTGGGMNTANGASALGNNTTGSDNTATGYSALSSNTTGFFNVAVGGTSLAANTTGTANTATGLDALRYNNTGHNNTASGYTALQANTIGYDNTASGSEALLYNTTGFRNTACGTDALTINTTGSYNTALGYWADVTANNLTNATAIGYRAQVNASNKIRLGNGSVTVIEGQVAYTFTSDSTKKENFRPVNGEDVLRKIREFNLRSWNYVGNDPEQFRHYGPMAQEFFAAFGHDGVGTSGTPTTINSGDEAGILMIAIQALEKRTAEVEIIKADKERLAETVGTIKAENQELEAQIAELRELIRAQMNNPK